MRNGAKPRFAKAALGVLVASVILVAGWRRAAAGAPQMGSPQSGMPQSTAPQSGTPQGKPPDFLPGTDNPLSPRMDRRVEHMREDDRHKHLEGDAQRLLQMATELKEQVDKTPKDQLSIEVIRRANEIEKLARDIRERMKN